MNVEVRVRYVGAPARELVPTRDIKIPVDQVLRVGRSSVDPILTIADAIIVVELGTSSAVQQQVPQQLMIDRGHFITPAEMDSKATHCVLAARLANALFISSSTAD